MAAIEEQEFEDPRRRYEMTLSVLACVRRYLSDVGEAIGAGADLLRNPCRLGDPTGPIRGVAWPSAADISTMLEQWHACLVDAWACWNALSERQRVGLAPPGCDMAAAVLPMEQWRACVADVSASWNALSERQRVGPSPPVCERVGAVLPIMRSR